MPSVALSPVRRLVAALLAAILVAFVALAGSARADDPAFVFEKLGCGTRHFQKTFTTPAHPSRLELSVRHFPGRWGQMTVRNSAGTEVWSFRQSYAWISGSYELRSAELAPGSYTVDYWSDNLAQIADFCNGTLGWSD